MWDDQKRARFQELRQRERQHTLTEAEKPELALLVQELEDAEAAYLVPATKRIHTDRERIEAQNSALESLVNRREALARHLSEVLAKATQERRAIDDELATVLGNGPVAGTDD